MTTDHSAHLELPAHLSAGHRDLIAALLERNEHEHGEGLLGLVLSGSAGRGLATERSDVDIYVVLTDDAIQQRGIARSTEVDEIPIALSALERVPPFASADWWFRWSFAWAPVLLDRTEGRIARAAGRQATLGLDEHDVVLIEHYRLDGWINYAYRALKSDRDGRARERRLDAAESMPWLLDVVFTLAGRVRPYHKYLPWELREHPLTDWPRGTLLDLLERTLDGDPAAIRDTFSRVESLCEAHDAERDRETLHSVIQGWGQELTLFRA